MMRRAWLVFGLTACCVWGAESSPHDGSSQVFLHCDFDTDAWLRQWGLPEAPERTQLVQADLERKFQPLRGQALRVHVEQGGHYGLSLTFPFKKRLGYEPEEVYFPFGKQSLVLRRAVREAEFGWPAGRRPARVGERSIGL